MCRVNSSATKWNHICRLVPTSHLSDSVSIPSTGKLRTGFVSFHKYTGKQSDLNGVRRSPHKHLNEQSDSCTNVGGYIACSAFFYSSQEQGIILGEQVTISI